MGTELSPFEDSFSVLGLPQSDFPGKPWVFWSRYEGCQNSSSSNDLGTPLICKMVKSAFSNFFGQQWLISQFWAPVTIGGRRVLSTSGQPFAVSDISVQFSMYRLTCAKYQYSIDENKFDPEPDHMIIKSGGPATAFLNRLPYLNEQSFLSKGIFNFSLLLPICFPSRSSCVGVLECTTNWKLYHMGNFVLDTITAVKKAGLDVIRVEKLIRHKTINDHKVAKEKIEEAIEIVCVSHNIALSQVRIAYEDKNNVPIVSSLEVTQPKQMMALKLTGYLHHICPKEYFGRYYSLCDVFPHGTGEVLALKTLQDHKSRYISKLRSDMLVDWDNEYSACSALVICLRSTDKGDLDYAFEFIWVKQSKPSILLEALLLTLKRCLPSYKFASGAQLGDEIDVIDVESCTESEISNFKIFQENTLSPILETLDERKKQMVVENIEPSDGKYKTTTISLPREAIEKQFGKTMKEAAKNLNVSESTLKRKLRKLDIPTWPGRKPLKRNVSSVIKIDTNEEDNGTIQEPSTITINQNMVTIKAEYVDDMIKFCLPISQATFETIEKEIGMKFKLSLGNFKLKYRDEVGDWILLTSHKEMSYCIESSRNSNRIVVQLRVLASP